jgi:hypothetical protein
MWSGFLFVATDGSRQGDGTSLFCCCSSDWACVREKLPQLLWKISTGPGDFSQFMAREVGAHSFLYRLMLVRIPGHVNNSSGVM